MFIEADDSLLFFHLSYLLFYFTYTDYLNYDEHLSSSQSGL